MLSLEKLAATGIEPDLVYVVNGSDPYEKDALPSAGDLSLSIETLFERDKMVFEFLRKREIPQHTAVLAHPLQRASRVTISWRIFLQGSCDYENAF